MVIKKVKQPWPTKNVMDQIYEKHLWGGDEFDFYSGIGSHDPEIINPYLEVLITFLKSQNPPLVVCDLGCGDFNIGKHLTPYCKKHIAVDIVKNLIDRNKKLYQEDNLEFSCLDIAKDELPSGDCIILRQVLQHLSNAEIQQVLNKIGTYKYLIITEHIPLSKFTPNKDILSGQGIRLKHNSGVNILETPFDFKVNGQKQLGQHILDHNKGQIITTLFEVY